jgi:hypothetical protein
LKTQDEFFTRKSMNADASIPPGETRELHLSHRRTMSNVLKKINTLPDYNVEHLDLTVEIANFNQCLDQLRATPGVATAEAACRASRRLLYAFEEHAWLSGRFDAVHQSKVQIGLELLGAAVPHLEACLNASTVENHSRLRSFFSNIAERRTELSKMSD